MPTMLHPLIMDSYEGLGMLERQRVKTWLDHTDRVLNGLAL
jgi:hypothetical protein